MFSLLLSFCYYVLHVMEISSPDGLLHGALGVRRWWYPISGASVSSSSICPAQGQLDPDRLLSGDPVTYILAYCLLLVLRPYTCRVADSFLLELFYTVQSPVRPLQRRGRGSHEQCGKPEE